MNKHFSMLFLMKLLFGFFVAQKNLMTQASNLEITKKIMATLEGFSPDILESLEVLYQGSAIFLTP